jgi:prepilin-type N-terminal cleavage/methylation domain-containing protein
MTESSQFQRGFTLIEILVALALMAMIATILITSLQIGGHTWQRVMRAASSTEDIEQAQEFLRIRLSSLYPDDRAAPDITGPRFLVSNGESLEFSGAAPESSADGSLRYQIAVSRESGALEVRSRVDRIDNSDSSAFTFAAERLVSHVASMSVQFWLKPDETPGRWVDRWNDARQIPRLIRIDVAFGPEDNRRWPSLYVEPRIDTPANCVFDVVSRRCRSGA